MIENAKKNCMGTVSFDGKFNGMRKAQDFIVYPMTEQVERIMIQSDKRSGYIDANTGNVELFPGKYFMGFADVAGKLSAEELFMLKGQIMATASGKAGTNGIVFCDNSGAAEIFGE